MPDGQANVAGRFREAPVLTTARLTLRGHRLEDFPALEALWADPVVTRFIGGRPSSSMDSWSRLLRYAGHWSMLGFGYWAVTETQSGTYLGDVGAADFHRPIADLFGGAPETGWVLAPQAHGKGYATEAMAAVLAWVEAEMNQTRTVCIIAPDNHASLRVAEKLGYRAFTRTRLGEDETIVLERNGAQTGA